MKQRSRKLQRVGDSYHISLPMDWIRRQELMKGDRLKLEYDESNSLTILNVLPDSVKRKRKAEREAQEG